MRRPGWRRPSSRATASPRIPAPTTARSHSANGWGRAIGTAAYCPKPPPAAAEHAGMTPVSSRASGLPPVVILCGGLGTRMREETEFRPKPMVEIGGLPLLWHIMKGYGEHGLNEFVCCLGYRGDMIKRWFLDYRAMGSDMTVDTGSGTVSYSRRNLEDWRVTLVDTGAETMTGGRIKRVAAPADGGRVPGRARAGAGVPHGGYRRVGTG